MNIAELRKAAEFLSGFEGTCVAHLGTAPDDEEEFENAFDTVVRALPKLLAVVEAAGGEALAIVADKLCRTAELIDTMPMDIRDALPGPAWFRNVAAALRALEAKEAENAER